MSGSVCAELRGSCREIWEALGEHPFLRELAAGELAPECFRFYLEQNLIYLPEYARAIALGAARSADRSQLTSLTAALENIVATEIPENEALLSRVIELGAADRGGAREAAPATLAYTSYLLATAFSGGTLEVMTAIMPCAWSYGEIARKLIGDAAPHPVYNAWLSFFASPAYAELIAGMQRDLDALAAQRDAEVPRLAAVFRTGARLERGFWDMAYGLERWPDTLIETGS